MDDTSFATSHAFSITFNSSHTVGPVFGPSWGQWAESQLHQGYVDFIAEQNPQTLLPDVLYDPFVPLVTNTLIWAESAYKWEPQPGNSRRLALQWTFRSDWLPLPLDWEPVFHPALAGDYIYIPGEYSSINKVDKVTG